MVSWFYHNFGFLVMIALGLYCVGLSGSAYYKGEQDSFILIFGGLGIVIILMGVWCIYHLRATVRHDNLHNEIRKEAEQGIPKAQCERVQRYFEGIVIDKSSGRAIKLQRNLFDAIRTNVLELVKYCVEQGDDVNAKDDEGNTPLHSAASNYFAVEVLKYLIFQGADVTLRRKVFF